MGSIFRQSSPSCSSSLTALSLVRPLSDFSLMYSLLVDESSFCTFARLTTLLLSEYLLLQHFFHHPEVITLAVDDVLQLLNILAEFIHLVIVELLRFGCRLLDEEAGAHVNEHMVGICQLSRHIQR